MCIPSKTVYTKTCILITLLELLIMSYYTAGAALFTDSLAALRLNSTTHFNAAIGARATVYPVKAARCKQGNHCISPWWSAVRLSPPAVLKQRGSLLSPSDSLSSNCNGHPVSCNHTCPSLQYSTPEPQSIKFDTVTCDRGGYRHYAVAKDMEYPLSLSANDACNSFPFVTDFSRAAAWKFIFDLDLVNMRDYNAQQFLLLEGKLVSPAADQTFFWTLDKRVNRLYLSLYTLSSKQFNTSPHLLYSSEEPVGGLSITSHANIHLFVRHVSKSKSSTCFYVNGVRIACLPSLGNSDMNIAFISLNSRNNFGLNTVSGTVTDVQLYEIGQANTVISDREIQDLYKASDSSGSRSKDGDSHCQCQHIGHPIMKRADWAEFGSYISTYSNYCYKDISKESNKTLRVNENEHGIPRLFDNDLQTTWVSMAGLNTTNISFSFPHKVKVKGLTLALSTLPQALMVWNSSGSYLIGEIRLSCDLEAINCVTWSTLTSSVLPPGQLALPSVPMLNWLFQAPLDTEGITLQMEGYQSSDNDIYVVHELSVIATCSCSTNSSCTVNHQADPTAALSNHKCVCSEKLTGVHCNKCAAGFYTSQTDGIALLSDSCLACGCDLRGTCLLSNGQCNQSTEGTCNAHSLCLCRFGNTTKVDDSNHKCEAELHSITPNHGPVSGGTVVTVVGKYLLGYNKLKMVHTSRPDELVERKAVPGLITGDGLERITFVTPMSKSSDNQFDIRLVGREMDSNPSLVFSYKSNPIVDSVLPRNLNNIGGLKVTVEGNNLDSAASPVLLTNLHCLSSDRYYDTVTSSCEGNKTSLNCVTPDLSVELYQVKCVLSTRLKRMASEKAAAAPTEYSGLYAVLGLQFDGFMKYQRLNMSSKTRIFKNPMIKNMTAAERLIDAKAVMLEVIGVGLSDCCTSTDYKVTVGGQMCPVEKLTVSRIFCRLPPRYTQADYGKELPLVITLGQNITLYSSVIAKGGGSSVWDDKGFVLTVAISVTITFMLAMVVSTAVCCFYHQHFFKGKTNAKLANDTKHAHRHDGESYKATSTGANYSNGHSTMGYMPAPNLDLDAYNLQSSLADDRSKEIGMRANAATHYVPGPLVDGDIQYLGRVGNLQYIRADGDIQYLDTTDRNLQYVGTDGDIQYIGTGETIQYVDTIAAGGDRQHVYAVENVQYMDNDECIEYVDEFGDVQYMDTIGDIQYLYAVEDVQYVDTFGDIQYADTIGDLQYLYAVEDMPYMNEAGDMQYRNTVGDVQYRNAVGDIQYEDAVGDIQYVDTVGDMQYVDTVGDIQYVETVGDIQYEGTVGEIQYEGTVGDIQYEGTVGDIQYGGTVGDIQYEDHSLHEADTNPHLQFNSLTSFDNSDYDHHDCI